MRKIALLALFLLPAVFVWAQKDTAKVEDEKIKTGWTFGVVPAIAYDSDIGFKYGGLVNFYEYGDGSTYPQYRHSLYLEWSRTTKGSGINQFIYDSEYLIPNIRLTAEASLLTERALDFYGFNGYNAYYNDNYELEDSPEYKSRLYYRHDRELLRIKTEFQGQILGRKFRWLGAFLHYGIDASPVDIENLNEGKSEDEKLPLNVGLYDDYIDWGIIPEDQKEGGNTNFFKLGLVWDTRDNEANPFTGIWAEALLLTAPKFLGNKDYAFHRLALTHRQYFTLIPKKMNFAYRLSYQTKLGGIMPFYMLPFVYNSNLDRDGLGGAKTLRGILRNRIVGEDFYYGNLELRWKPVRTIIFNQNFHIALSSFLDFGQVTGKYKFDSSGVPDNKRFMFDYEKESIHTSYGFGVHFILNHNFVVAVDYGIATNKNDGDKGLYIGMNFLF